MGSCLNITVNMFGTRARYFIFVSVTTNSLYMTEWWKICRSGHHFLKNLGWVPNVSIIFETGNKNQIFPFIRCMYGLSYGVLLTDFRQHHRVSERGGGGGNGIFFLEMFSNGFLKSFTRS